MRERGRVVSTCQRCKGSVIFDARSNDEFCIACGARVYSAADLLHAEVAVARMATGPGRERNRGPRIGGVRLD